MTNNKELKEYQDAKSKAQYLEMDCAESEGINYLVVRFVGEIIEIPLPSFLSEAQWEVIVSMGDLAEQLATALEQSEAENERLREVIGYAKAVNWRQVIRDMPRVIWWKYNAWRAYRDFEKSLESLKGE